MATAGGVGTESGAEPEERFEHAQPLRAREADGLVTLEVDDTYVLAVVSTNGDRAGWYARLYDALSPTIAEQAGHQDRFRRLLPSEIAATVKLAVPG